MRGFTKAVVAGNVTRDPEMRTTPSGSQVCSFTIAVNRSFRGSDGNQQESVSYLDCVAWGKSGETINQYIHKGSALLVSGRLEQRSWDDKNTGQKRSRVEIVVDDFSFIGGDRAGGSNGGGSRSNAADDAGDAGVDEADEDQINLDEIPF